MKQIYKNYFQKSKVFLYPLLEIPKGTRFVPVSTYIDYNMANMIFGDNSENKFYCLYVIPQEKKHKDAHKAYRVFEQFQLKEHSLYEDSWNIEKHLILYMFDFSIFKKDLKLFREGKYSQFSEYSKKRILNFFGEIGTISKYVESYLYPEHYYETYSELLNIPIDILEETKELCDIPDKEKETFKKESIPVEIFK